MGGQRWLEDIERSAAALLGDLAGAELAGLRGPAAPPQAAVWVRHESLGHGEVFGALGEALAGATDPERRRTVEGFLELSGTAAERVAAAKASVKRAEVEAGLRVDAEGEQRPYRALPGLVRECRDSGRRHALEAAFVEGAREVSELAAEEVTRARYAAAELGGEDYVAHRSKLLRFDVAELASEAERVLDRTGDVAHEVLPWLLRDHVEDPGRARLADLLHAARAPGLDGLLPSGDLDRAEAFFARLGLDARAGGRLHRDLEPARGEATWLRAVVLDAPGEVHLVGRTGPGLPAYRSRLGELGRALHAAGTDPRRSLADRRLRDGSVPEGFALLFGSLLQNPHWGRRVLRLTRPDAERVARVAGAGGLLSARRLAARLLFEVALYRGEPDSRDRFAALGRRATGVEVPGELFLVDLEPGLGVTRLLRAHLFEASAHLELRERYDEDWFLNPRAGDHVAALFAEGRSRDLHVLADEELGRPLAVETLATRYETLLG